MIENSLPTLAYRPAIHVPKPVKAAASDVQAFVRADQEMAFGDFIDLASVPSGSTGAAARTLPSHDLRLQWEAMCKAVHEKFADDFNPDSASTDFALAQKKADLRDAAGALKQTGLIGQYFARWCNNVDRAPVGEWARTNATAILQGFNRFFGACLSCDVARQRIDAMLAAFTLDEDELFGSYGTAEELCGDGMRERLEMITQQKLKTSSNPVVSLRFYSTLARFATRNRMNVGNTGVHNVRNLGRIGNPEISYQVANLQLQLLAEAAKDLGHEIEELLQKTIPDFFDDLYSACSKPDPPTTEDMDALQDMHLFAWNALFPVGTSGAALLRNKKYVVWNDIGTAVADVKWDVMLTGFLKKMMPFMNAEALLSIVDNNAWAAPLKDDIENDSDRLAELASSSAESYRYIKKRYPDHIANVHQYHDPATGQTCLHKLAAKRELALLIRKGEVDPHQLLENEANGKTPLNLMLDARDRTAIEALYLRCLYRQDRVDLHEKMRLTMQYNLHGGIKPNAKTIEGVMKYYSRVVESEESIAFYRGLGDPEKASWLAELAHKKTLGLQDVRQRQYDQMTIAQLETLVRIVDDIRKIDETDDRKLRVPRFIFDSIPPATLRQFSPRQLEEVAKTAHMGQAAIDTVNAHFDAWKDLSAEGMAAFRDLLRIDCATSRSGETFLLRHLDEFLKLGGLEQVETAAMFAGHRKFIERHAKEWFRLDHTQMRLTRRALEAGLLGKLGTIRIDPRWKLANPLIDPQKKWFKLDSAQMTSMVVDYGKDRRVDKQVVKHFPMLRKLDHLKIRQTVESFKKTDSSS